MESRRLLFLLFFFNHFGGKFSAFLDLLEAFWTIPAVTVVVVWSLREAYAWEVEPLVAAFWVIAGDHVAVRNVLAEAVGLLDLVSHGLYLI